MEKILLVEDDNVTRASLGELLRDNGYTVAEAKDGAEAIEMLEHNLYDLVVSDFVLPKLHGVTLVHRLQSMTPKPRMIVLSGYLSQAAGSTMLEGWAKFIEKPVQPEVLLATVKDLLMER
jgi:CheY-like chemotaxis protein